MTYKLTNTWLYLSIFLIILVVSVSTFKLTKVIKQEAVSLVKLSNNLL